MRIRYFMALGTAFFLAAAAPVCAEQISGRWELESAQAAVGRSLVLTLEIEGADKFTPPDLSVPNVEISFQGGGPRNSTSIVSVNGKMTRTDNKSWVGSWSLKSLVPGSYHIDAQNWSIGNGTVFLPAINWQVTPAQNDKRFMLKQRLSQDTCVPGIEVEYTLIWYIGQSVQNPDFTLPILDNSDLVPVESSFAPPSGDTFQMQYNGRVLTGVKSVEYLNGQQYTALTVKFRVKPTKPGRYDLSGTMVSFEGAVDSRQTRDFFGNIINEPVYRTLVAQADPAVLSVKELPSAGKPVPFSGLIGKLELSWNGAQGRYHVGEPIRLSLKLSGVLNKPNLDLDHMVTSALDGSDFQVSSDLAAKDEDGSHSFIFRARHPGKMVVPPLKINYFDPREDRYGETSTKALSFDISGSQADTAAGTTAEAPAGNGMQNVPGSDEKLRAETPRSSGAPMNPNGLPRPWWPSIPWWAFAVPGFAAGLLLSLAALWRYAPGRQLARERKSWRSNLSPLAASGGRAALEEGRARLYRLSVAGSHWRKRLDVDDRLTYLQSQIALWDEAFFAEARDAEPWLARWDEARCTMEVWK